MSASSGVGGGGGGGRSNGTFAGNDGGSSSVSSDAQLSGTSPATAVPSPPFSAGSPPSPAPVGTFSGARVGSMRIGGGSIAGFAAQPGAAKAGGAAAAAAAAGGTAPAPGIAAGSRPQSMRTAPPSPLPPAGPVTAAVPHQPG